MRLLILLTLFTFISCGKSPLLNEAQAEKKGTDAFEVKTYFKTTGHEISLKWLTDRTTTTEGKALVILSKDSTLSEPSDKMLGAYLWMGSMGHGSSPIVVSKLGTGIYQLTEMYFTMTGDWQLHLTLNQNSSIQDNVEFKYDVTE